MLTRAGPDAPLLVGSTPSGFPIHQQSTGRCHRHLDHEFRVPVATSECIMRPESEVWIKMVKIICASSLPPCGEGGRVADGWG